MPYHFPASAVQYKPGICCSKGKSEKHQIKLSATKLTYNQKVQRPKVSVTYKGKVLKEKKNYVLKYSKGCKKVGTYTVQIIGKGAYAGKVKKQFTILPPKTQVMGGYVGKKTVSVIIKRQTAQTSGYQLRYATNSKLKKCENHNSQRKQKTTPFPSMD